MTAFARRNGWSGGRDSSREKRIATIAILCGACLLIGLASIALGAAAIAPARIIGILRGESAQSADAMIVLNIRLPRTLLGFFVGGALALAGALLQALFRNPLADPGVAGISGGAALGAVATIVLGDRFAAPLMSAYAVWALPVAAFLGSLVATTVLYALSTRLGRTSIATMLLAGVGLGSLAGSLTGLLATISDDRQLRDLTFWLLGSLGGANWSKAAVAAALITPAFLAAPFLARSLNALALGEAEAFHLGVRVERDKRIMIALASLAVGVGVALAGPIGFIGIVAPHLIRLTVGADHRLVLPASILLGGSLLVLADILARTIAAPAETPIGILTGLMGAPFFLWLLSTRMRHFE